MAGFGVLITFVFFIYIVSRDRSQLVGLGIPLRSIAKPPSPATAQALTLPAILLSRDDQETLNTISHLNDTQDIWTTGQFKTICHFDL